VFLRRPRVFFSAEVLAYAALRSRWRDGSSTTDTSSPRDRSSCGAAEGEGGVEGRGRAGAGRADSAGVRCEGGGWTGRPACLC